jgi:hypothetical protein
MKYGFKKHFAFLLILTLLSACINAVAEVKVWQLSEEGATMFYEITKFDAELPDDLMEAMAKTPWAGWQCAKGIRQEERVKTTNLQKEAPLWLPFKRAAKQCCCSLHARREKRGNAYLPRKKKRF